MMSKRTRVPRGTPLDARILHWVEKDDNGCWLWRGYVSSNGYGMLTLSSGSAPQVKALAHRVSYETFVGSIPDGQVVDHLCRVRHCVNPSHMELVTQRENVLRSPVAIGAINAAKTHCAQGHPFTPENTRTYQGRGYVGRECRACRAAYARAYRESRKVS